MSREDVERIFRGVEWFNERDVDSMVAECHPDVEFHTSISAVEGEGGVYRGFDAIRQWLAAVDEAFGELHAVMEELHEIDPDRFLGAGRMRGRGLGSDAPFDLPFFWVVRQRDGLLWRWEGHFTQESALESLGLEKWPSGAQATVYRAPATRLGP